MIIYYDKLNNKFNFNIRENTLSEKEVKRVIKEGITDITKYKEYSIILNSLEELNQLEKEIGKKGLIIRNQYYNEWDETILTPTIIIYDGYIE